MNTFEMKRTTRPSAEQLTHHKWIMSSLESIKRLKGKFNSYIFLILALNFVM